MVQVIWGINPLNGPQELANYLKDPNHPIHFTYDLGETARAAKRKSYTLHTEFLDLAIRVIERVLSVHGSYLKYKQQWGRELELEESLDLFKSYILDLGLQSFAKIKLMNTSGLTRTGVCADKIFINQGPGIKPYRSNRLAGLLDHEIGTHYLRWFNDVNQCWHQERGSYGLRGRKDPQNCTIAEEGLATLHNRWAFSDGMRYFFVPALRYYAAVLGSKMGFKRVFEKIKQYVNDDHECWNLAMRVKRTMSDPNLPGGYYKDQAYFIGAVTMLQNRKTLDFREMMSGRITLGEVELATRIRRQKHGSLPKTYISSDKAERRPGAVKLPPFMKDMEKYHTFLDRLAQINFEYATEV